MKDQSVENNQIAALLSKLKGGQTASLQPEETRLLETALLHWQQAGVATAPENRYRTFFENSHGLMCTHDLEGNILFVNTAGAGMIGYTPAEVTGRNLAELLEPGLNGLFDNYLNTIKKEGKASGIMKVRHRDGTAHVWLYNNTLETEEDGSQYVLGNSVDITEKYRLEKELQRVRDMLERTNQVARVGGWEVDIATRKIYWTAITRDIHEVEPDFVPDVENVLQFYKDEATTRRIADAVERAVTTGASYSLELQLMTGKQREIWVRSIGHAEFEDGVCKRLIGTFQDIDEIKKKELELASSRRLLQDVFQSASEVSIIAADTTGVITVFNTGAERMLGYSAEEMIGKQRPNIFHEAAEVKARAVELSQKYNRNIEGFETFVYPAVMEGSDQHEWTYIHKNGKRFTVSLVVTPIINWDNSITGYLGVATDITRQKAAEQQLILEKSMLHYFVENTPAAVAMFDTEVRYISCSKRWLEEYRLGDRDLKGLSHYEVFPTISEEWKSYHRSCLAGAVVRSEEDVWRPSGWDTDQYLRYEVRPWYQPDGSIGGIMMLTQDITEMCLQREELRHAKQLAEQASKAKSEFLANMSHEIRTPLNGVIGFTDLILKTSLDETQRQYLSIVSQSGHTLLSIISDILDFSKIEAGKLELAEEKSDLYELVSQAADVITYQVQQKGLEILLNIPPSLPRYIWCDSIRLKQILVNLLGNAAKFTEQGEVELKIEVLDASSLDELSLRFSVRDTGIGIHPEKQHRIFDAFLQEDSSTTKKYGGTGLGLSISNRLLELMGSHLSLQSQPGKGSTFSFELQLKAEEGEVFTPGKLENIRRVLIVDDNRNNRTILKQMLRLKNIQTTEAASGLESLQLLSAGKEFDVILMDYHMPVMDGLETIRKIRENFYGDPAHQPLILLHSSSDDNKILSACTELKINARLVKPIKIQQMYAALEKMAGTAAAMVLEEPLKNGLVKTYSGFRIMIAEDNPVNMLLSSTILSKVAPGAELIKAENGAQAVAHCEELIPDLIFMDVLMPEKNGYEATKLIRELLLNKKRIPIIALTASNIKGERERCLEAGMDDFVTKPIIEEDIRQVLQKWLAVKDSPSSFDRRGVEEVTGNDRALMLRLIQLAQTEIDKSLVALQGLSDPANMKALKPVIHSLRGTAAAAGMARLGQLTGEFEQLAGNGQESALFLVDDIIAEMKALGPVLQEQIVQLSEASK